jgi:hypothetical protein
VPVGAANITRARIAIVAALGEELARAHDVTSAYGAACSATHRSRQTLSPGADAVIRGPAGLLAAFLRLALNAFAAEQNLRFDATNHNAEGGDEQSFMRGREGHGYLLNSADIAQGVRRNRERAWGRNLGADIEPRRGGNGELDDLVATGANGRGPETNAVRRHLDRDVLWRQAVTAAGDHDD